MTCATCRRDEKAVNNDRAECSLAVCPHRRPLTARGPQREDVRSVWKPTGKRQEAGCYRAEPVLEE